VGVDNTRHNHLPSTVDSFFASITEAQIALIDTEGKLHIVFLDDGKDLIVDTLADGLAWSGDGAVLYYWRRSVYSLPGAGADSPLVAYELESGQTSTVVTEKEVRAMGTDPFLPYVPYGHFAVSPDGTHLAFAGGWLYLLSIGTD